ncbi:MAG: GtrA family protein [Anaerolineales bacterium]|nr:GtrA family protein [Anaerolineales bacterium]MDW8160635.1 GtrA family protein [Anaerolineales bacterium]
MRFAIVGTVGSMVDFGFFNLFAHLIHLNAVLSSIVSFWLAVINNFTWNRRWIYPDSRAKSPGYQFALFALTNFIGLIIRTPLFIFLEGKLLRIFGQFDFFRNLPFRPIWIAHNFSLGTAILVVMLWNFYLNRYLTFNDVA